MSLESHLVGSSTAHRSQDDSNNTIVTLNVGGQIFQTSPQTLRLAGPESILSTLICPKGGTIPFIDRDPELFSILLSFLRRGTLPSRAKQFDPDDIISEAQFYNIHSLLNASITNLSEFDAFKIEKAFRLPLNGRDYPSAIAPYSDGSVIVSHGNKITSFDWSLRNKTTILTEFTAVDSLLALSPAITAAGATDFSGVQIIEVKSGCVRKTLGWENQTHSGSTVQALGSSPEFLFVSFESERRNSNSIMVFDSSSFQPVTEISKQEIYGVDLLGDSIPATKLIWASRSGLLLSSGLHGGPSGFVGSIKLWDIRVNRSVWGLHEKDDCFADITICDELYGIFKVGVMTGDVFMADLRKLGVENPWNLLGKPRMTNGRKHGVYCKMNSHGSHVFCTRGSSVELWSEILMSSQSQGNANHAARVQDRVFRKNALGTMDDKEGSMIKHTGFGGNRMFLTREDEQMVEVWQNNDANLF